MRINDEHWVKFLARHWFQFVLPFILLIGLSILIAQVSHDLDRTREAVQTSKYFHCTRLNTDGLAHGISGCDDVMKRLNELGVPTHTTLREGPLILEPSPAEPSSATPPPTAAANGI